ncbi:MAG: UDP-2,3-diacylglucosamine diphosphatase LpxI [Pseudomonadota bacterium]|nr:UDP-2,3-diacylglucosamine diphosphatase LpxI [Pseudomonadota bacterium]
MAVEPVGIIAGSGQLPRRLAEAVRSLGLPVFVILLKGHADPSLYTEFDHAVFRIGAVGKILKELKRAGVHDLVMAGGVRRPSFAEIRPDWTGARILAGVRHRPLGDDGLLRLVKDALARSGFRVRRIDRYIRELLAPAGIIAGPAVPAGREEDIHHGFRVARALGVLDIGQSVVVQDGLVLGVEAIEGTDALIARCGDLRREGSGPILVKCPKPQQDRALDMPVIGPDTVANAVEAGFAGIAVEAGGTLIVETDTVIAKAEAAGLFVVGFEKGNHD